MTRRVDILEEECIQAIFQKELLIDIYNILSTAGVCTEYEGYFKHLGDTITMRPVPNLFDSPCEVAYSLLIDKTLICKGYSRTQIIRRFLTEIPLDTVKYIALQFSGEDIIWGYA